MPFGKVISVLMDEWSKEMMGIDIREALPEDADAMREVQHRTWVATYPNEA